ncbi:MAG TPA: DUF1501 domain-containing protein [Tepidisphaeraceae bacterium]|jgi:hypothetical protein
MQDLKPVPRLKVIDMLDLRMLSRRDFLKTASAATLATLAAGAPRVLGSPSPKTEKIKPTCDTIILLWMAGGMAHTETFDPKRYTPFEKGLASEKVLSTFPAIDTVVDNIKISAGLENIAKVLDRGTLIRSHTVGDLGKILHSRHQYHWHTGYAPPQTVAAPHLGSWIAKTLGPNNPVIPAFIDIGQRLDLGEGEELKAFHTAGFLGSEFGPFMISEPAQAMDTVRPPKGMSPSRFQNREKFYKYLVKNSPAADVASDYQKESLLRSIDQAHRLLNDPAAKAFDLTAEPKESYDAYNTGRFGLGCLLAKRLTQAGARFIEVTSEYIPFLNWDTHADGHKVLVEMKKQIDRPIAQLILDLEKSGHLDRTLIVIASEFSRDLMLEGKPELKVPDQVVVPDTITEPAHYGMHRHFTGAGSVLLFGGGFKKGFLYGQTADERPCTTIKDRITIEDLHATIYRAIGIAADHHYMIEQRPFYVTNNGEGKARMGLFA